MPKSCDWSVTASAARDEPWADKGQQPQKLQLFLSVLRQFSAGQLSEARAKPQIDALLQSGPSLLREFRKLLGD